MEKKSIYSFLFLWVTMLVVVWIFFESYPQYQIVQLLVSSNYKDQPIRAPLGYTESYSITSRGFQWSKSRDDNENPGSKSIQLTGQPSKTAQFVWYITIPDNSRYLTVSAIIKSNNILSGKERWHGGRLDLQFLDNQGKVRWDLKREVIKLLGSNEWKQYKKTFPVPDTTRCARLIMSNSGAGGTVMAEDLTVTNDLVNPSFLFWKKIAGIALLVLLGSGVLIYKGRAGYLLISLALLIVIGTTLPNRMLVETVNNSLYYGKEAYKQYTQISNQPTGSTKVTTQINLKDAEKKRSELRQEALSVIKKGGAFRYVYSPRLLDGLENKTPAKARYSNDHLVRDDTYSVCNINRNSPIFHSNQNPTSPRYVAQLFGACGGVHSTPFD